MTLLPKFCERFSEGSQEHLHFRDNISLEEMATYDLLRACMASTKFHVLNSKSSQILCPICHRHCKNPSIWKSGFKKGFVLKNEEFISEKRNSTLLWQQNRIVELKNMYFSIGLLMFSGPILDPCWVRLSHPI